MSRRTNALLPIVVLVFALLIAGCTNNGSNPPTQPPTTVPCTGQSCLVDNSTIPDKPALSPVQQKLASDLLLKVNNPSDQETHVYVYIQLNSTANATDLNPLVRNVTDYDPVNHRVVAWTEVKNLMTIASLESVQSIRTVVPPVHG